VEDSPYRSLMKAVLNEVGRLEIARRKFEGLPLRVGVHVATKKAHEEIIRRARAGRWPFSQIPGEADLRRRLNYMADPDWLDEGVPRTSGSPEWHICSGKYEDMNPWKDSDLRTVQSCYELAEDAVALEAFR